MLREEEICETLINPCKNSDLVVARGCAVHFCAFWGVPDPGWLAGWLGWRKIRKIYLRGRISDSLRPGRWFVGERSPERRK